MPKTVLFMKNDVEIGDNDSQSLDIDIPNGETWDCTDFYFSTSSNGRLKFYYKPDGNTRVNPFCSNDTTPIVVLVANNDNVEAHFPDDLFKFTGNGTKKLELDLKSLDMGNRRFDCTIIGHKT
jgi:hypothetical protein